MQDKNLVGHSNLPSKQKFRESVAKVFAGLSQENWNQQLNQALGDPKLTGDRLFQLLDRDSELKVCYTKDSGTQERYTVGEHSKLVLRLAEKFSSTFHSMVAPLCTWNEFLLFLALHDSGKGIAYEQLLRDRKGTPASFKKAELSNTCDIIQRKLTEAGIPAQKIQLFKALLAYDTIGIYLKKEITEDEACERVMEMARTVGVKPLDFYQLFVAYHMADAGSYPGLFNWIFTVKDGKLFYTAEKQGLYEALCYRILQLKIDC